MTNIDLHFKKKNSIEKGASTTRIYRKNATGINVFSMKKEIDDIEQNNHNLVHPSDH